MSVGNVQRVSVAAGDKPAESYHLTQFPLTSGVWSVLAS